MISTRELLNDGILTFSILVDGTVIPNDIEVYSIRIEKGINAVTCAKIVVLDGDLKTEQFKISSSSTFIPGNKMTIKVGYNNDNNLLFEGVICEQNIKINKKSGAALVVVCYDEAIKTTISKNAKTFIENRDSDVISTILDSYSGITKEVALTEQYSPQLVQYNCTDWDFILSRAAVNGMLVKTINGKFIVEKPDANTTAVLRLKYGETILAFDAKLSALQQFKKVKTSAWNYKNQSLVTEEKENSFLGPGNLSSTILSEVVGLESLDSYRATTIQNEELQVENEAQLVQSNYAKIQGHVSFQGISQIEIGNYIQLEGVGDRFNGDHFVSQIIHDISKGVWTTTCNLGISETWFTKKNESKTNISNLMSAVHGLLTAKVKQIDQDPKNQYRIRIEVPLFNTSEEGIWARHASFYASNNAGAFFMPEIGDEVIVGFLNEDSSFPIILGSLYSNPNLKPFEGIEANEDKAKKVIVSKSGISLAFDDEKNQFSITTPKNNATIFRDTDSQIIIQDENSNTFVLSEEGILLKSINNISIESDKQVIIKGTEGISLESDNDISSVASNIKHQANQEFSAEGINSAKIESSASLTLQGALVHIN